MQYKTSLINKELQKLIFRSVGWISILQFAGLFFALPLQLLALTEEERQYLFIDNLFSLQLGVQIVFTMGIPVLMAIFLFRFLHVRQYSDYIHSLPITRKSLFHQYTLTGILYLTLPLVLITLIILVIYQPFRLDELFSFTDVMTWFLIMLLFHILFFLMGVFIGTISGISAVQGALTYIGLLLPLGMLMLITINLSYFLTGFSADYILDTKLESFSPLVLFSQISYIEVNPFELILYCLAAVCLYVLALYSYKHRPIEAVSHALVFPFLKPVFKYGVTFCMMLLSGLYFGEIQEMTSWLVAGYILGAIVGYLIAEMVLQKSWRITFHVKGLAIFTIIMVAAAILFKLDLTQFEKKIPQIEEIQGVHLSESYFFYQDSIANEIPVFLKQADNISAVRELHESILEKNEYTGIGNEPTVFMTYLLKSGEKVVRSYQVDLEQYEAYFKKIEESQEYKTTTNTIFHVDPEHISELIITANGTLSKRTIIDDKKEMQEAIAALKRDIESASYENMTSNKEPLAYLEVQMKNSDNAIYMSWQSYDQHFHDWLQKQGLLEQSRIMVSDIQYVYVLKKEMISDELRYSYSYQEIFEEMSQHDHVLKLKNKEDIETLLDNASYSPQNDYIICYVYSEGEYDVKELSGKDAPASVVHYFENK
ncbi:DUF6449 domain-containing protein [Cytobacillus gottheilii]|uniref:DUF6449 domain-containing protein n=1 Tax=Cytobacillus gottheilii TaxID=859144 RepID=UPI0009BC4A30|nr:DUF6449 domain-containing protein [Cytobacillus gottheilii]